MDDPTVSVAAFGGSMHLADPAHNSVGTSGIVGQSIAHAAGAALTARLLPSISIPYSSQLKRPDASCWSTRAPRHGSVAALIAAEVAEKGFQSRNQARHYPRCSYPIQRTSGELCPARRRQDCKAC